MGRKGGAMPGAGRKRGKASAKTLSSRDAWKKAYARFANASYRQHVKEARDARQAPTEEAPPKDTDAAAIHHIARLLNMSTVLAIKGGQYQAAIQGLQVALNRCWGREPYQLEHGGIPDGEPIAVAVEPGLYRTRFPDGTPLSTTPAQRTRK